MVGGEYDKPSVPSARVKNESSHASTPQYILMADIGTTYIYLRLNINKLHDSTLYVKFYVKEPFNPFRSYVGSRPTL
jgi:hypothetical protein